MPTIAYMIFIRSSGAFFSELGYNFRVMEESPRRKTVRYIDPVRVKKAARLQTVVGAFILVFSGVILYSLPAKIFYLAFLAGIYFFFSGIIIVFSIVGERTARKMAKYLVAYWILNPKR